MDAVLRVDRLGEAYRLKSRRGWRRRHGAVRWALRDVSFELAPGECLGVVGANGSGKSTLLSCLGGVLVPTEGSIARAGRVASLIDLSAGLHRELTGRENILVSGVLNGMSRRELRGRLDDIVDFSGLDTDALDSPLRTYSAGMALRLAFSVVVHTEPAVLLVDEVLAVGDEEFQSKGMTRIAELRATGTGVVLVSHELDVVAAVADRVAVLEGGRLEFLGATAAGLDTYRALHGGAPPPQDLSDAAVYGVSARRGRGRRHSP